MDGFRHIHSMVSLFHFPLVFVLSVLWLAPGLLALPAGITVKPEPEWVLPPPEMRTQAGSEEANPGGVDYRLFDWQVQVEEKAFYQHTVYRVTNASGLQSSAEISFDYDPAYQELVLHHVRVIRDGHEEDRLEPEAIEVIRQERERERALYNGRLTAILQLRDVRVGDTIDYAFTIRGENPIFAGRYFNSLWLGWGISIGEMRYRIVAPDSLRLQTRQLGPPGIELVRTVRNDRQEFLWQGAPLPAIRADAELPDWYVAYPLVQIGEFKYWSQVVDWALPLYDVPDEPSPELAAKIEVLRGAGKTREAQALAAINFVQNDVRYLGIELGVGSHRPRPPAETLANRFGDCKDKSLLLCALLRALDIEAWPVLVASNFGPRLQEHLPSPIAFDHVIVCADLSEGRRLWFDPTIAHQTGDLDQHSAPNYGQVLVLRPGETRLTGMTLAPAARARLREKLVFTSESFEAPAQLRVTTTYHGLRASGMRSYFLSDTAESFTREYLNYYAKEYPGITSNGDIVWRDDTAANVMVVEESYTVPNFWTMGEEGWYAVELFPYTMNPLVAAPTALVRSSPLRLYYPNDQEVEIVCHLPEEWAGSEFDKRTEDPHFLFTAKGGVSGRTARLHYHYETKQDAVEAEQVTAYADKLAGIRKELGYSLSYKPSVTEVTEFSLNLWTTSAIVMTATVGVWVGIRTLRRPGSGMEPPSLGGWLILPAIGMVMRPFVLMFSFFRDGTNYFDARVWSTLVDWGSETANLGLAIVLIFEVVTNTALIGATVIGAILFFSRRREAPAWVIVILIAAAILPAIDSMLLRLASVERNSLGEWIANTRSMIVGMIWVPYFVISRRVRETFVA